MKKFKWVLLNKEKAGIYPAILGDRQGNVEAGHNEVFVWLENGEVIKVQNYQDIPLIPGLRVAIKLNPYNCWEIAYAVEKYNTPKNVFEIVCAYCGSSAPSDERGNCGACGAPRYHV